MADITLRVNGDSSGAQEALRDAGGAAGDMGEDVGKSVVKWQMLADVTKKAVEAVVKFGVDAVKAYAESERVQKQLVRVAGEYSGALAKQAEAMSRLYAVDDDVIKQSQTLLTQWGGVGAASEEVTKAVLDYAAATGQDAVAATQDLIRNVESGGVGLAKMGVHFTATGDKGRDLAAAVGALSGKFGGAAGADASSLSGSLAGLSLAFEDLQKDIGEAIAGFMSSSGVVGSLTEAVRGLRTALFGDKEEEQRQERLQVEEQLTGRLERRKELEGQIAAARKMGSAEDIANLETIYRKNEAAIEQLKRWREEMNAATAAGGVPGAPPVTGRTNAGRRDDAQAAAEAAKEQAKLVAEVQEADAKRNDAWREAELKAQEEYAREQLEVEKERISETEQAQKDEAEQRRANASKAAEDRERQYKMELEAIEKSLREQREAAEREFQRTERIWAEAGAAIGAALVESIASQLERLANGEELDATETIANVIGDVLAVAGQIIGTAVGSAYGGPGGAQLGGAIGGAIGGLSGAGVKALGRASRRSRSYHSGGWIGDEAELPRYHSGGYLAPDEVPIIAQKGEYMLSRQHVANMGGPAGVEAAAQGAPRFAITVQAMDSQSVRAFFENQGGRGFYNALRTGRGTLLPAFGGT